MSGEALPQVARELVPPCPPEGCQGLAAPPRSPRTLVFSLGIVAALMAVQLVGAYVSASLVIALDAVHMFTDLGAIGLALFAAWIARKPASPTRTFGYHRAEILAALANGAALCMITFFLAKEAWERLASPSSAPEIHPKLMIIFGSIAFVANCANALILHRGGHSHAGHDHGDSHEHDEPRELLGHTVAEGHAAPKRLGLLPTLPANDHAGHDHAGHDHAGHDHAGHDHAGHDHAGHDHGAGAKTDSREHDAHEDKGGGDEHADLNLRGALLHILGDVLGSLGAIGAGCAIYFMGWTRADAVFAAVMAVVILVSAVHLVVRSVDVLLESTPRHVDMAAFDRALRSVAGVAEIHDLHIWTLTGGVYAMSCHATVARGSDHARVLAGLQDTIRSSFRINHTTIQLEDVAASI